jgi:hypothetical protein
MADKFDIVSTINSAGAPITMTEIGAALQVTAQTLGAQMARLKKDKFLNEIEKDRYVLSEKGIAWMEGEKVKARRTLGVLPKAVGGGTESPPPPAGPEDPEDPGDSERQHPVVGTPETKTSDPSDENIMSEASAGLTDYNLFFKTGIRLGAEKELSAVITEHVWRGGSYEDIDWVWKALSSMQVRRDIAKRWWESWRSHLMQSANPELAAKVAAQSKPPEDSPNLGGAVDDQPAVKAFLEKRKAWTHILIDDVPTFVGEGKGDMTYEDAKSLAEVRATAKARGVPAAGAAVTSPDDVLERQIKLLTALASIIKGDGSGTPKSYLVTPSDEGGPAEIREIEPGQPIVAPAPRNQPAPTKTWVVNEEDGTTQEIDPGKPFVIIRKEKAVVPADGGGKPGSFFFLNPATQSIESWDPSKGPFMMPRPAPAASSEPVVNMGIGPDGKQVMFNLSTYFALEEHKEKLAQKRESFEMKQGLVKDARALMSRGIKAFSRMSGEEEEGFGELPPPVVPPGGADGGSES